MSEYGDRELELWENSCDALLVPSDVPDKTQTKCEDRDSGGCTLAAPGRGDCEHAVGLPGISIPDQHDGPDDTEDCYGKPNGWCWSCWKSHQIEKLRAETLSEGHTAAYWLSAFSSAAQDVDRLTALRYETPTKNLQHRTSCAIWGDDGTGKVDGKDRRLACSCGAAWAWAENREAAVKELAKTVSEEGRLRRDAETERDAAITQISDAVTVLAGGGGLPQGKDTYMDRNYNALDILNRKPGVVSVGGELDLTKVAFGYAWTLGILAYEDSDLAKETCWKEFLETHGKP